MKGKNCIIMQGVWHTLNTYPVLSLLSTQRTVNKPGSAVCTLPFSSGSAVLPWWLHGFSHCCYQEAVWPGEKVCFGPSAGSTNIVGQKPWDQGRLLHNPVPQAAGEEVCWFSVGRFLFPYAFSLGCQPKGWCCPHSRLSLAVSALWKYSHGHPRRCASAMPQTFLYLIILAFEAKYHTWYDHGTG